MSSIQFTVNGKICTVTSNIPLQTTLNAYLRYMLALPGTKAMCHQGGCGSCIVTVRARRQTSGQIETFSVNSCLVLIFSCQGWDITTAEGLGNRAVGYGDIQKRIAALNGTQCGYCTPGWVMALNSLQNQNLTMAELETQFGSNTCRCTGYRPILDTIKSFAVDATPQLCKLVNDIEDLNICTKSELASQKGCTFMNDDVNCDFEIVTNEKIIYLDFGDRQFYKVYNVDAIFDIWNKNGVDSYMLIDGNTAKGVIQNFQYPTVLIDISDVYSLKQASFDQNLLLGANITIEDCITIFNNTAKSRNDEFGYLSEFAKHFQLISNVPKRKIGSIAGNLMLKYYVPFFQSDVFLLFAAVNAMILIRQLNNKVIWLSMIDFRKYDMRGVLILKIALPPLSKSHVFRSYKIMPRRQNALAIVHAAYLLKFNNRTGVVDEASIVYGNITPTFVYATTTQIFLRNNNIFTNSVLQRSLDILKSEIVPMDLPPRPSPTCRQKLALGLFYKFILNISSKSLPSPFYRSGGLLISRPVSKGSQNFQTNKDFYPLNEPVPKYEAIIQSSGEAQYTNDIPPLLNEVFGAFVLATIHYGEIGDIDASEVLKVKGVVAVYTAKDIPGDNNFIIFRIPPYSARNQEILASKYIRFYGQPVAIVVANTEELAARIAKRVKVTYKNVSSNEPVLTISQAQKDPTRIIGNDFALIKPKDRGNDVKKVIKGSYEVEAQYHYYIEPITCVVIPVDKGLEIYDATQWTDLSQEVIAKALNLRQSDVFIKVRRLGGGFGGKLNSSTRIAASCALVAHKLDLPCRFILPIDTNMTIAGKRYPSKCEYEVGVDMNGKIQYLDATITEDNGYNYNDTILQYTFPGFGNCYNIDNFKLKTATATTDLPGNTFARAPGTLEGIASIENIMQHIAFTVEKDINDVRMTNMRPTNNDIPKLMEELKQEAEYQKRLEEVKQFNQANRWMKKAIELSVMLFYLKFDGNYSAMVSIYNGDGTVTVTTGGIEMGQGINTKTAQVCAYELGIPLETVTVLPSFSFVAANNANTAKSITSESICYAVMKACNILNMRLKPIKESMTNATWLQIINEAARQQIDLRATYMMKDSEPDLMPYNAYGVSILEVQLDILTGRFEILRVDILEDVGFSLSPNVDVGQLEGAYVQGLGYFTSEKLVYDKKTGRLLTNDSLTYHVPLALDIPADFRIKFKYNSRNPNGVLGSKAVGEMGTCTTYGITHALRNCIMESRKDSGCDPREWITIDVPYDTESILKALDVRTNEMVFS